MPTHILTTIIRSQIRLAVGLIVTASLLWQTSAQAAVVNVNCGGGGKFTTIAAALTSLDRSVSNTIQITGTCDETVTVRNFAGLTLQGAAGQTAVLRGSTTCDASIPRIPALTVLESSDIVLRDIAIWNGDGLALEHSRVKLDGNVKVKWSCTFGVDTGRGSFLELSAPDPGHPNIIEQNNAFGIYARFGSEVVFQGQNEIRNQGTGIIVHQGSRIESNGSADRGVLLIENNGAGISVVGQSVADIFGGATIRNNKRPGIEAVQDAHVCLMATAGGTPEVSNNSGPGIVADTQAKVILLGSRIAGNGKEGVRLLHMSVGRARPQQVSGSSVSNTISGNVGSDASCDSTSMIFGDFAGIGLLKCSNAEEDPKK